MITLHINNETFSASKAVRETEKIILYGDDNSILQTITGISKWDHIILDGDWSDSSEIPSEEEKLRADVDFLTMENESLEGDVEQAKADIDYLLMITEEE